MNIAVHGLDRLVSSLTTCMAEAAIAYLRKQGVSEAVFSDEKAVAQLSTMLKRAAPDAVQAAFRDGKDAVDGLPGESGESVARMTMHATMTLAGIEVGKQMEVRMRASAIGPCV